MRCYTRFSGLLLCLGLLPTLLFAGIHEAVSAGDTIKISELLRVDATLIDEPNDQGDRPLHTAARTGNSAIVRLLLGKGASVTIKAYDGATPLHRAVEHGKPEVVRLLIDAGADVNAIDDRGETPLHAAALTQGKAAREIAELLLQHHATLDARSHAGLTPLSSATTFLHTELADFYIKQGASIFTRNTQGETVLHLAVRVQGIRDAVGKPISPVAMVKVLLLHGADLYAIDQNEFTVLHAVASTENVDTAEYLLGKGLSLNSRTETGATALHIAAGWARRAMTLRLFQLGADINAIDHMGRTPLHEVATVISDGAEIDTLKVLMAKGARIDTQDKHGETALHIAAKNGCTHMVAALLYFKADATIKNTLGKTAMQLAKDNGYAATVELLTKKP